MKIERLDGEESRILLYRAAEEDAGLRLDVLIARQATCSRSAAARYLEEGAVTVNEMPRAANYRVRPGDTVRLSLPELKDYEVTPENIPLDVVYEDADVIVINKPVGMVVHPAPGNPDGTLVNALLYRLGDSLSGVGGVIRPGIVHRIDKDTSGLLVVAKNDAAHGALSEALSEHRIRRVYYAIAVGRFSESSGTVDAPIGRHPVDRKRMAVIRDPEKQSKPAVTHWETLAEGSCDGRVYTLLRCHLETGRTHQIRVHLSSIGHPLLGDPVYGGDRTGFESRHKGLLAGQALHAGELHFLHPISGDAIACFAPLPETLLRTVTLLFGREHSDTLQASLTRVSGKETNT